MKVEKKAAILDELPKIRFTVTTGDADTAMLGNAGCAYPMIQIGYEGSFASSEEQQTSPRIIGEYQIASFNMDVGVQCPIPKARLIIRDNGGLLKNSMYFDEKTEVVVFIGDVFAEPWPTKFVMKIEDMQYYADTMYLDLVLKLPTDKLNVTQKSVEEILKYVAETTKLGLKLNFDEYDAYEHVGIYTNLTVYELLPRLFDDLMLKWFIDNEYNICCIDIQKAIQDHVDEYTDIVCSSGEELKTKQKVHYTNSGDIISQFTYGWHSTVRNKVDDHVVKTQAMEFDAATQVDTEAQQTEETQPLRQVNVYDTSELCFDAAENSYLRVGHTIPVTVFTDVSANQVNPQNSKEPEDGDISQKVISDYTGVYLVQHIEWKYTAGAPMLCRATMNFREPTEVPLDDANMVKKDLGNYEDENNQSVFESGQDGDTSQAEEGTYDEAGGGMLSKYLSYAKAIYSNTARARGISNNMTAADRQNAVQWGYNIYDKIIEHFGAGQISLSSMYRSQQLNKAIPGSSKTSQHMRGQAGDIQYRGPGGNAKLFVWIRDNLPFDQLLWEFGSTSQPQWVHVSYKSGGRRLLTRAVSGGGYVHAKRGTTNAASFLYTIT